MRTVLLILAGVFTASQILAQEISLTPNWRQGDMFELELTRTREDSSRPQQNGKSRTLIDVQVVSAAPDGAVIDWVFGETVLDNPQQTQNPLATAAFQAVRGMRFRLNLDSKGEFIGLDNEAEVLQKIQSLLDVIVAEITGRLPAEQRQAVISIINQVLSPNVLLASSTREVQIYFGLNAIALAEGDATETDLQLPNPFSGGQIPARFRVEMESVSAETASLKTTTTYDAEALKLIAQSMIRQVGAPLSPEELAKLPVMQVSDEGHYIFDRTRGLMREVALNRRISTGDASRFDGWQIRLLNGPTR